MRWRAIAIAGAASLGLAGCKQQKQDQGIGQSREQAQASQQAQAPQQGAPLLQPGAQGGLSPSEGSAEPPHAGASAQANARQEIAGRLAECPQGQIVIRTPAGNQVPVRVGPNTQVVLNGQPAEFAEVQPGSDVRASLDAPNAEATRVEVTPPRGSAGTGGAGTAGTSSAPPSNTPASGEEWCQPLRERRNAPPPQP